MKFTVATTLSAAILASATPIERRQVQQPDTVYGVDPSKAFYLSATVADGSIDYVLQPFYLSVFPNIIGLQAVQEAAAIAPKANFTLRGSHYGTQIYTYKAGICTSPTGCPGPKPPALAWSNDSPNDNTYLTFHQGVDGPSFGGLALYGEYHGGDFAAGEDNYLVGAQDTDLTKAFAVCDYTTNPDIKLLSYHGTNSSCTAVTVRAFQVPDDF